MAADLPGYSLSRSGHYPFRTVDLLAGTARRRDWFLPISKGRFGISSGTLDKDKTNMNKPPIEIKRLEGPDDASKAYCCMTEVSSPWPDAVCLCRDWVANNLGQFVEGYHVQTQDGEVIGHLYYAPSERALFPYQVGPGVTVLYCDWVQTLHQGRNLGRQLYDVFLADRRQAGSKGIVVEATDLEGQMYYRHYLKRGFKVLHESGHRKVLYHPLSQPSIEIQALPARVKPKWQSPAEILILNGYLCPYEASTLMLVREVAKEFGPRVQLKEVWLTPETLREYGAAKGVFINGVQKLTGAETEVSIRLAIAEEI